MGGNGCIRKEAKSKHAERNIDEAQKKLSTHTLNSACVCVSITVLAGRSRS